MIDLVFWLPSELLDAAADSELAEAELVHRVAFQLHQALHDHELRAGILTVSCSLAESELVQAIEIIDAANPMRRGELRTAMRVEPDACHSLRPRRVFERNNVGRVYREQFFDGVSVNFINTPTPKNFTDVPAHGHFWVSELKIEGYQLPPVAGLGAAVLSALNYSSNEIRVSRDGLAYHCPNIGAAHGQDLESALIRPSLRLLEPLGVFRVLFERAGFDVRPSDKGDFQLQCVRRFGSPQGLADFVASAENRALLDAFMSEVKSSDPDGVIVHDRRCLMFGTIEIVLGGKAQAETLVDSLVGRDVLHRGFIFQCDACRNSDWYSIDDVGRSFKCSRCSKVQVYTKTNWKQPSEPRWFYKLDEVVYQARKHNFHVPVLLSDVLRRRAWESFFSVPELEVRKGPADEKPYVEIDLCCCLDGIIILGEATITDRLANSTEKETADLERRREIAAALGGTGLVLATFASAWHATTRSCAESVFSGCGVGLEFIQRGELVGEWSR